MNTKINEFLSTIPNVLRVNDIVIGDIKTGEYFALTGEDISPGIYARVTVEVLVPILNK